MTIDRIPGTDDSADPWRDGRDAEPDFSRRARTGRSALALSALLTAGKVALALMAILVVLPAAMAAQGAIAR